MTGVLKVVESEDVLHLGLSVDDRARTILDACLDLLAQELLQVVWLLVGEQSCQVLWNTQGFKRRKITVLKERHHLELIDAISRLNRNPIMFQSC